MFCLRFTVSTDLTTFAAQKHEIVVHKHALQQKAKNEEVGVKNTNGKTQLKTQCNKNPQITRTYIFQGQAKQVLIFLDIY